MVNWRRYQLPAEDKIGLKGMGYDVICILKRIKEETLHSKIITIVLGGYTEV